MTFGLNGFSQPTLNTATPLLLPKKLKSEFNAKIKHNQQGSAHIDGLQTEFKFGILEEHEYNVKSHEESRRPHVFPIVDVDNFIVNRHPVRRMYCFKVSAVFGEIGQTGIVVDVLIGQDLHRQVVISRVYIKGGIFVGYGVWDVLFVKNRGEILKVGQEVKLLYQN